MVQNKKSGMWLQEQQHSKELKFEYITKTMLILPVLIVLTLNFTKLTGFGEIYSVMPMIFTGVLIVGFHGFLIKINKKQLFYPCVFLFLLVFVLLFRRQILDGMLQFWNQLGAYRTAVNGKVVPMLSRDGAAENNGFPLLCFSVFTGGLLGLFCSLTLPFMSLLLPMLTFAGMLMVGAETGDQWLFLSLLVAVLYLTGITYKHRKLYEGNVIGWLLFSVVAFVLSMTISKTNFVQIADNVSTNIRDAIHDYRYETEDTTLPEGQFSKVKEEKEEPVSALAVTMDVPEAMYLRGYTGAVFENDTWKPLDSKVLAEQKYFLYWLNLNHFYPDTQFAAALKSVGTDSEMKSVSIQNVGACSKYLYVPVGLESSEYLSAEQLQQSGVLAEGQRTYSYSVMTQDAQALADVLDRLQIKKDKKVETYRKAESAYRDFVYEHYLQLSRNEVQPLISEWDKIADDYGGIGNLTISQAQECTMIFLSQCFSEDGQSEPLNLPLSHLAGSSYRYATVAALTFRYFGIPSRYAEGYVITDKIVNATKKGETMNVNSSHAGAWVEVYQDGIGWIPMNLIPGIGELTKEQSMQQNTSNNGASGTSDLKEGEELTDKPDEKESTEQSREGMVTGLKKIFGILLWILCLLLLVLLVGIVIRRNHILKKKEKIYGNENRSNSIAGLFADTMSLVEHMGIDPGTGSLKSLTELVKERFGEEYASQYEIMVHLNDEAIFSSHELSEEQRMLAKEFRLRTLDLFRKEVSFGKRLWTKWIRCLY